MPVYCSWLHLYVGSKYAKIEGWLTLHYLAGTRSANFVCLEIVVFPGRAYLLNDTYLIRTYKNVNGETSKIEVS